MTFNNEEKKKIESLSFLKSIQCFNTFFNSYKSFTA